MIEKYALFKVLEALINSDKLNSIREIAKVSDVGVGTAKTCLDYLQSKNIVEKIVVGRNYSYKLSIDNVLTRYVKTTFSIGKILGSGLIGEIVEKHPYVISIVLYGSVARGDDDSKSDIDILIISRRKIVLKPLTAEKKIDKELTFLTYTIPEWRQKAKTDKPFYDRIIIDGIALYGEIPTVI